MTKWLILIIFLSLMLDCFSQKEANIWYFGDHAGLDFSSGSPVALTNSAMWQSEGVATISDSQGNLLFYTNGIVVYNKNHEIMDNGTGLLGGSSSTQSCIIVPQPMSNNLFYIFTVPQEIGTDGLRYSMVDINLNGGLGAITTKNIFLIQPMEEKVTAVLHSNKVDIWVITHTWNSSSFYCYLVTATGINPTPVISDVGTYHSGSDTHGYLRASPCGNKLAITIRPINSLELFDFDNSNGSISNPLTFPSVFQHPYGIEFSPDESRLYLSDYGSSSKVYQYNLNAGTPAEIFASITLIGTVPTTHNGALQIGPDDKIYSSYNNDISGHEYLGVIHSPNELGTACNFEVDGLYLNGGEAIFGLPNFIQSYFCITQNFNYLPDCYGDTTVFFITNFSDLVSVLWDFDDPPSGSSNISTEFNPSHIFSESGIYNVKLISYFIDYTDTLIKPVIINASPEVFLGNDTTICSDTLYLLNPGSGFSSYFWQDGSTNSNYLVDTSGIYWVEVTNQFGCSAIDSILISLSPSILANLGNDTSFCSNETTFLDPGIGFNTYLWQNGSTDSSLLVSFGGLYWVTVTNEFGCSVTDSIFISLLPAPEVNLGNDTLICEGNELLLDAGSGFSSYLWNDGTVNSTFLVDSSGIFWVEVMNEFGCSVTDSIIISYYPMALEELDLGPDTTFCKSTGYILNAGSGYTFYQWQDGSNDSIYIADTAGLYYVYVENPCSFGYDSIYLEAFPVTDIDLGNDTTACSGSVILLDPGFGFISFLWNDGSMNQFYSAGQPGLYWVEVIDNNFCPAFDTIAIDFVSPDPNIGNDTILCSGENVTFYVQDGFVNYFWQDGSTLPYLIAGSDGTYWCEVTDTMGCLGRDTVNLGINYPPVISLGNDTSFCPGENFWLKVSVSDSAFSFHWQDGSTDSSYQVTEPGYYWVSAVNECGAGWDSVYVDSKQLPMVFLGNDTIIFAGDQILLDAGSGFEDYIWVDGSTIQTYLVNEAGTYWVNVFDGSCYNTDTILIEPVSCDLFIPIVFTPNGDPYNESFYAQASKDVYDFYLQVFNRWGEEIWFTRDKDDSWDGTHNGSPAAEGSYFWLVSYKCSGSNQTFNQKGSVTLLR